MKDKSLLEIFFGKVPLKIVMVLGNIKSGSISELSRMLETSYAHVVKVLKILEANGVVKTEMEGRVRRVELTDRGIALYRVIKEVEDILSPEFPLRKKIKRIEEEIDRLNRSGSMSIQELIPLRYEIELLKNKTDLVKQTYENFKLIWERTLNEQM